MAPTRTSLLTSINLEQIIDQDPLIVAPEMPLSEVVAHLSQAWTTSCHVKNLPAEADLFALPAPSDYALILSNTRLLGLFTEQDMVRLIASGQPLEGLSIQQVMVQPVITLSESDMQDVFSALNVMRVHQIRHLPVINANHKILGVVTPETLQRALHSVDLLRLRQVREVMDTEVIHIPPTVSVLQATQLMTHHRVSCVVITEHLESSVNTKTAELEHELQTFQPSSFPPHRSSPQADFKPLGIITERDIVQFHRLELVLSQLQVQAVMSTPLLPASPKDSLWQVCQQMQQYRVRRLVVIGQMGELQGIITLSSILQVLDPMEMYGVLDMLQGKIRRLEAEKAVRLQRDNIGVDEAASDQLHEGNRAEKDRDRLFALSLDLFCVASMDGFFKCLNPAFEATLGYQTAELLSRPFLEFVHPADCEATLAEMAKLATGEKTLSFENRYRCQDGSYKWLQWSATPYIEEQLLYATARDVTEQKRTEDRIREQAALLEVATDAIWVQDLQGQVLFWNRRAEQLYGWRTAEAIGKNVKQLMAPEALQQYAIIQQTLKAEGEWQGDLQQVTQADQDIIVESRWALIRDQAGAPKSVLVVNTDITEKKQLEAQLLRSQRLESLGTLAGGIAHDLNNILTPILSIAQIVPLKIPDLDDQTKHLLDMLKISADRGAALVKQVLSFSRGIEGEFVTLQLRHLVDEIRNIIRETFPKTIELQVEVPQDTWTVRGDATQLHQVLMNLCVNSRDAMPNGGNLSITLENLYVDENYDRMNPDARIGPYLVVTVTDTGIGIPVEILDKIFDPFFTTKAVGKGTGLGLSTLIGIVKNHNGFTTVSSEVGHGTQFQVYLPAAEAVEAPTFENSDLPTGEGELVLVVDDEVPILEITQASLEMNGYTVLTANDGIEAIALYAQYQERIRVVLMDLIMPSMGGVTAIRTLQKINPEVKIIATSGLSSSDDTAEALSIGAKRFLDKPYTSEVLLITIHSVLHGG